jgi:hypothetical protein
MTLVVCLFFLGCADKTIRIEGEVIKIFGTLPGLVQSSGALFGNESVKINNPSLVYVVKVGEDVYTLDVFDNYESSISKINLASRICLGTRISFTVREGKNKDPNKFDPNFHAGSNRADDIGVAKPCVQ